MNAKSKTKMDIRIDDVAKATISILSNVENNNPGTFIVKDKLFPKIITRIEDAIEDSDDLVYDELAIGAPDFSFLHRRWPQICNYAADHYKKYIIWSWDGVRLGTLDEYQNNQQDLAKCTQGFVDKIYDRTNIIVAAGGQSFVMRTTIKYLSPGDPQPPKSEDNHG